MDEWCAFLKKAEEDAGTELGSPQLPPSCHALPAAACVTAPPRYQATTTPYCNATVLPGESLMVNLDSAATTEAAKKKKKKGWDASKLEKSGIPTLKRRNSEAKSGWCP